MQQYNLGATLYPAPTEFSISIGTRVDKIADVANWIERTKLNKVTELRIIGFGIWAVFLVIGFVVAGLEVRNAIRRMDRHEVKQVS